MKGGFFGSGYTTGGTSNLNKMDKESEAKIVYNALEELSKCRSEPAMYGDTPITLDDIPGMKEILDLHENQKACVKKYRALGYNADQILVELQKL